MSARQPRKGRSGGQADALPGKESCLEEDKIRSIGRSLYALLSELRSTRFLKNKDDSPESEEEFLSLLQRVRPVTQDQRLVYFLIQSLGPNQHLAGFLNNRGKTAYGLWAGPAGITSVLRLGSRARVVENMDGSFGLSRDIHGGKSRGKIVVDDSPRRSSGPRKKAEREPRPSRGIQTSALLESWKKKRSVMNTAADAPHAAAPDTPQVVAPPDTTQVAAPDTPPVAVAAAPAAPAAPASYASAAAAASYMGLEPEPVVHAQPAVAEPAATAEPVAVAPAAAELLTRASIDFSVPWGEM